jgi:hypothetical protein
MMSFLTGLLYIYRAWRIEKHLNKILYFDYQRFDRKEMEPVDYFTDGCQLQNIVTNEPILVENKGLVENSNIPTDRQDMNDGDILQLKQNKLEELASDRENFRVNNLATENTKNTIIKTVSPPKMISIPDYEQLKPTEQLDYDRRSTITYFKDVLILNHPVLSLIFYRSLKFPKFIELSKLIFSISMLFGVNAMCYTDDVIDQRQTDTKDVNLYIIVSLILLNKSPTIFKGC